MFTLSKVLALLAQPSTLAAVAMGTGLWLLTRDKRPRLGARLAWGGFLYIVLAGMLPLGNALILPLEERFASVPAPGPGDRVDGIILLGGFEDGRVSSQRGGLAVNESAERPTEGLRLALKYRAARVVFSGGVGGLWPGGDKATGPVATFLRDAGVAEGRLVLEGRSRNTYENARFTAELVQPKPGERWLLVTSAFHMPRAVGLFRKAGFDVRAFPVDYRTRGVEDLARPFERIPAGLMRADHAASEWLGLLAYRLMGRIDEVLPGP